MDKHQLLFGKKGIADASVVEIAEHGRAGGVSTGQPFKFVDFVNYAVKITEDGSITYIATANPGTAESAEAWKALKLDSTSGLVITWADGDCEFDNVATDLTALDYS
jgi:hypothetical protein